MELEKFNVTRGLDETCEAWGERFYTLADKGGRLFRHSSEGLMYIDPTKGPVHIFGFNDFYGLAHNVVEVVRTGRDGVVPATLSWADAQVLYKHSAQSKLRRLRAAVREPVIIPFDDGTAKCSDVQYDPTNQADLYYFVPPGERPIEPLNGVEHLKTCFAGVPFERPEYRNNLIAWLLGAVVFDRLMNPPFLVVSGNQQGIGKSVTVQAAGYILTGELPSPIDYAGAEFGKQLSARFRECDRLIFLDNVVTSDGKSFDNPQLSGLLTQGFSKKLRILGKSSSVSAEGLLFAASLNDAKLSADLATRSLLVKLYKEKNSPMEPFCTEYAMAHRRQIYGELLGLAMRPSKKKCDPHEAFRFRRWLEFVQPRIEEAFGKMAVEEVQILDDKTQELFHFGADRFKAEDPYFTVEEFVTVILSRAVFPAIKNDLMASPSDHGRKVKAGRFLSSKVGYTFALDQETTLRLVKVESASHGGTVFKFDKVAE